MDFILTMNGSYLKNSMDSFARAVKNQNQKLNYRKIILFLSAKGVLTL